MSIFLLIWSLPYIYWLFASGVLIGGIVWILMPERN